MSDEGTTDRWFGLTARQFRKDNQSQDGPRDQQAGDQQPG
jgi:hypothetical protein